MDKNLVCAVVPVYNEEHNVASTISELIKMECIDLILAVDDGSTDYTYGILKSLRKVTILKHEKNIGKAESIFDGIKFCDADVYVFIDGDLGYSAGNIKPVIEEVINGRCDLCVANIPMEKGNGGVGFLRWFSKYTVKYFTGLDFPCPMSGQRAVRSYVVKDERVHMYHGYGVEVGMLIDCLLSGYRVKYIDTILYHDVTGKDIRGYIHRFRQFIDIFMVFIEKLLRW